MQVGVLAAPSPWQLSDNVPGQTAKAIPGTSAHALTTHVRDTAVVPGFWLQSSPAHDAVALWRVNQQMGEFSICTSFCLCQYVLEKKKVFFEKEKNVAKQNITLL